MMKILRSMLWLVVLMGGFPSEPFAAPVPSLQIQQTGTELEVTFAGRLQPAAQAAGPFTNVPGAFSPQRLPRPAAASFWRAFNPDLAHYSQRMVSGDSYCLAIAGDGTLWAWGDNTSGQLGIGVTVSQTNLPQRVGSNLLWKAVAAGCVHALALRNDGTLWAWGSGGDGKLGNGSFSMANSPQSIMSNATWKAIGASCSHSAAARAEFSQHENSHLHGWRCSGWHRPPGLCGRATGPARSSECSLTGSYCCALPGTRRQVAAENGRVARSTRNCIVPV